MESTRHAKWRPSFSLRSISLPDVAPTKMRPVRSITAPCLGRTVSPFPAELAEDCVPNPVSVLNKVEECLRSRQALNQFAAITTPTEPIRIRVIVCYGPAMVQLSERIDAPPGIVYVHDGGNRRLQEAIGQHLKELGKLHGVEITFEQYSILLGNCEWVDRLASL